MGLHATEKALLLSSPCSDAHAQSTSSTEGSSAPAPGAAPPAPPGKPPGPPAPGAPPAAPYAFIMMAVGESERVSELDEGEKTRGREGEKVPPGGGERL